MWLCLIVVLTPVVIGAVVVRVYVFSPPNQIEFDPNCEHNMLSKPQIVVCSHDLLIGKDTFLLRNLMSKHAHPPKCP